MTRGTKGRAASAVGCEPHGELLERVRTVADQLAARRYSYSTEIELQDGLALTMTACGLAFEREVEIGQHDVIDFVVPMAALVIGVEVKVREGVSALTRQLHRYARAERLDALILATPSSRLRAQLPGLLMGKPLVVAHLIGSVL